MGSVCLFSLLRLGNGKMIALQESSCRKENRLWLLLARKKKIINKAANNVSVRGSFRPFLFLFLSCQFNFSLPLCTSRFLFLITFIFTLDRYHINTIHSYDPVPLFYVDESFSGLKMSCHFLIRKPRSIWPPLMILRGYLPHICSSLKRTTGKSDAINLTICINFILLKIVTIT